MKFIFKSLLLLLPALALAGEVGNYPNSVGIDSTVRFLADQGGPAGPSTLGTTVNITPAQLQSWLYPLGYLPASLMPILTGDCSTTTGSFAITCTKTNGVLFSSLATATTPGAVIALFTGCTGTDYLGADGNCHATSGAGTRSRRRALGSDLIISVISSVRSPGTCQENSAAFTWLSLLSGMSTVTPSVWLPGSKA